MAATSASEHDSVVMDDLLHGEEQAIYGDKAYAGAERQADTSVSWRGVAGSRKACRGLKLNAADKTFNRKSNRTHGSGGACVWRYQMGALPGTLQRVREKCGTSF